MVAGRPAPKLPTEQGTDADKLRRRDETARAALQGMLAHSTRYKPRPNDPGNWHDAIAKEAYELADAMELARKPN